MPKMSHRYFSAGIEVYGAALAGGPHVFEEPGRNTEKRGIVVSIGSSSSIVGETGEPII